MGGIGAAFWLYAALALMLCAAAITVVRAKPSAPNALYAVMTLCQAGNLLCMAIDSAASASLFDHERLNLPLRHGFDLATLAAAVHLSCTHPRRLRAAAWLPAATWLFAVLIWLATSLGHGGDEGAGSWWVTQAALLTMGCLAVGLMHLSFQSHPHPFALVMKRFSVVVGGTWILVQAAVILMRQPAVATPLSSTSLPLAIVVWQVLFALVLASVPFLSKSRSMVRELSLFAIIGTLAVVLDLLFVSVLALQHFAALTLALFLSMAVYAGARQWLVNRMLGTRVASTERLFEQLFRTTREVETDPEQAGPALSRLLKELFDPFEVTLLDKTVTNAHTLSDGSAMRAIRCCASITSAWAIRPATSKASPRWMTTSAVPSTGWWSNAPTYARWCCGASAVLHRLRCITRSATRASLARCCSICGCAPVRWPLTQRCATTICSA